MSMNLAEACSRLEAFLSEKAGTGVAITGARQLTGGASRETWAVDAEIGGE